jgi:hypothetical protein
VLLTVGPQDARSPADYQLASERDPIREPGSLSEVVPIGIEGLPGNAAASGECHGPRRAGHRIQSCDIERIHAVAGDSARQFALPAQAVIERQAIGRTPVILRVPSPVVSAQNNAIGHEYARRIHFSQQEDCEGIAGPRSSACS